MKRINITEKEAYLFKIARAVLKWADVPCPEEDLAHFVMSELINIKGGY